MNIVNVSSNKNNYVKLLKLLIKTIERKYIRYTNKKKREVETTSSNVVCSSHSK